MADDVYRHSFTVPVPQSIAFATFVERFGAWWPQEYTFAQERLAEIAIEAQMGGRCFERDVDGVETVWGRVIDFAPPHRLGFAWQITPDRRIEPDLSKATMVELSVTADRSGPRARIDFAHCDFARHGEGWEDYLASMASPQGWPYCLDRYVAALT